MQAGLGCTACTEGDVEDSTQEIVVDAKQFKRHLNESLLKEMENHSSLILLDTYVYPSIFISV